MYWLRAATILRWADVAFLGGLVVGVLYAWEGSPSLLGVVSLVVGLFAVKLMALPFWKWYDDRHYWDDFVERLRRL